MSNLEVVPQFVGTEGRSLVNKVKSVGIIGLGSFGSFVSTIVPDGIDILGLDPDATQLPARVRPVTIEQIAEADIVIPAVPLGSMTGVLAKLGPILNPDSLLIDVCSVKTVPANIISKALPDHANIALTHPLFGPHTASEQTAGHTLVVTEQKGELAAQVIDFCVNSLGLHVKRMNAETHDQKMAIVHSLTFFVAKILEVMDIDADGVETPSFKKLKDLADFSSAHSPELFDTIQLGNPFAEAARETFIQAAAKLNKSLRPRRWPLSENLSLEALRHMLDRVDTQLFELLAERFRLTRSVGRFKKQHNMPAIDSQREAQQFQKIGKLAETLGLSRHLSQNILRLIIDEVVSEHKKQLEVEA